MVAGWQVDSGWVAKIHFHDGMMAHLLIVSHRVASSLIVNVQGFLERAI
jgi:hypothetical protein